MFFLSAEESFYLAYHMELDEYDYDNSQDHKLNYIVSDPYDHIFDPTAEVSKAGFHALQESLSEGQFLLNSLIVLAYLFDGNVNGGIAYKTVVSSEF